eukprot:TRINITY_DN9943_c0_g1_i1.p1 TRINITY_DN9943_c0_g1~~TRINITY_DN9943_c0_g1_i1.p1  ORF type:complete len:314 (+),score=63.12 TRINITY_DN9943_c0_g1_i1:178-1119(+)
MDDLLKIEEIKLIVLSIPNEHHYTYARAALLAGKHVVVEKPFTVTSEEANDLISIEKERNLVLAVYHNRRFDGDFLTVQSLLRENRLGNIVEYEAHYDRFRLVRKGNWKDVPGKGVGIVYDLGSHIIDQALVLFGMPHSVTGRQLNQRSIPPMENSDYFSITMHYPVGFRDRKLPLEVILKGSTLALGPPLRYCIKGDRGEFIKYGVDPQEDQLKAGLRPGQVGYGEEDPSLNGTLYTVPSDVDVSNVPSAKKDTIVTEHGNYLRFYESVAHAITSGDITQLSVRPEEARDVIRIIEAAATSFAESRTIVFQE